MRFSGKITKKEGSSCPFSLKSRRKRDLFSPFLLCPSPFFRRCLLPFFHFFTFCRESDKIHPCLGGIIREKMRLPKGGALERMIKSTMLCEQCKKRTATVFYNEKLNGRSRSLSLCGECASKLRESGEIRDVTSMIGSFADPFSALQDERFGDFFGLRILRAKEEKILCPSCGRALAAILNDGKVGCAECYSAFSGGAFPSAPIPARRSDAPRKDPLEIACQKGAHRAAFAFARGTAKGDHGGKI